MILQKQAYLFYNFSLLERKEKHFSGEFSIKAE